ncbi:MAG TPA: SGNH/GDSL hydrolase family protein [Ignavibacteriaceae bacterium]|nr:SGNH/GDSL hydrolase family protein [Ignavibacteriaceae bacterium]
MNRIFFHLIILLGFQLIASCEFFESSSHIDADDENIEYIGRFDFTNPKSVRFDWAGVQIRTRFEGTSCSIKLKDGKNDYNVFIDGRFHKIIRTTADTIYVLANGLEKKNHTLLITKRTEAIFGMGTFEGFILDAGKSLVKPKEKDRRKIEFIGDSYFTGFGSEGDSPDCLFSRETQNSYLSFGPQLARKLDADYSIVAISGSGAVKNYGDSLRTSEYPLPHYYERSLMNDSLPWNFSQWQPDAVVVRLGRNDYWQKPHPKRETFRSAYLKLLKDIRKHYPNAHIFALCSPLRRDPHCDYISSVVNELNGKNKDKKIHFIKLDVKFNQQRDFGCEKHPNRFGHKKIADFLEPIIRKEMKWESLLKRIFPANPLAKI